MALQHDRDLYKKLAEQTKDWLEKRMELAHQEGGKSLGCIFRSFKFLILTDHP